jgi:translation initiation factor 3 subunit M
MFPSGESRCVVLNHDLVPFVTQQSLIDAEGLQAATEAAVGAIRDPVTLFEEQRNMMDAPPIKALADHAKDLHGLLEIFQEGKLQDYHAFPNKDAVLSKYNLNDSECVRYMRILSLCSLAADSEEVPYDSVAKTLEVPLEEVEPWVIAAVSSGLLSAKMDQIHQKIMVERSVVRKFDLAQWKTLQTQLQLWTANVKEILETLKQADVATTTTA